jgi:transcriptional regulator with XRE-family HTH domain
MIAEERKRRGLNLDRFSDAVGMSRSNLCVIENGGLKNGPDPQTVIKMSQVLQCEGLLYKYLEDNLVYQIVAAKVLPDLDKSGNDPAAIFVRLAREAQDAQEATLVLAEIFSRADQVRDPAFEKTFQEMMQKLVDMKRGVEILESQLVVSHIISQAGHHVPEQRTGTEG